MTTSILAKKGSFFFLPCLKGSHDHTWPGHHTACSTVWQLDYQKATYSIVSRLSLLGQRNMFTTCYYFKGLKILNMHSQCVTDIPFKIKQATEPRTTDFSEYPGRTQELVHTFLLSPANEASRLQTQGTLHLSFLSL